ncbi:hypothetical protein TFLX_01811 [Thermoflexales bacterium]|jgi:hypothetical protein|nr:hypothetical protein TFLX_01811 [Thermoflexales bacterium]
MIWLSSRSPEQLADQQYSTVVLRVVVNKHRQIVQGELIDTASAQTLRFKNWRGLIQALSRWLKNQSPPADRSHLKSKQS